MTTERLLVNFFYAHPVGHAIEALHHAHGYASARDDREVHVALNTRTPVELASWVPFVERAYAVDHPFLDAPDVPMTGLPGFAADWDVVVDDVRSVLADQRRAFPGMAAYYDRCAGLLRAERHTVVGDPRVGYVPHGSWRLEPPTASRERAAEELAGRGPVLALLPAGSSESALYPAAATWTLVLDALAEAVPGLTVVLVGRTVGGARTGTSIDAADRARLAAHPVVAVDAFDRPLDEQLALVASSAVFLSPHSGFGMAALAVGTPWLTLSGGRWHEYYLNHVPFRSVLPAPGPYPAFSSFGELPVVEDDDGSPRTPTMTRARVVADLDRLVEGALDLLAGRVDYEREVAAHAAGLVAAYGDPSAVWSVDRVLERYL